MSVVLPSIGACDLGIAPIGVRRVGDELENVFFMLHSRISINSDCVFPIIFEPI